MRAKGEGGEGEERGGWILCVMSFRSFIFSFIYYMGCRSAHHLYTYVLVSTRMCVLGRMVSPNDDKDA